jgi:hypothetical protein
MSSSSNLSTYNLVKIAKTDVHKYVVFERLLGLVQVAAGVFIAPYVPVVGTYVIAPALVAHGTYSVVRRIPFAEIYADSPKRYEALVERVGSYSQAEAEIASHRQ